MECDQYGNRLSKAGVLISEQVDRLVWTCNETSGDVTATLAYHTYIGMSSLARRSWWISWLWKVSAPLKIRLFCWLVIHDKVLTWENILKRGFSGPSRCSLCSLAGDSTTHLFGDCSFTRTVLCEIFKRFDVDFFWTRDSYLDNLIEWTSVRQKHSELVPLAFWHIWNTWNRALFNDLPPSTTWVVLSTVVLYRTLVGKPTSHTPRARSFQAADYPFPQGFFDGAALGGSCGDGAVLYLSPLHSYHLSTAAGKGTNTRAKMIALWILLWFAQISTINTLWIFGDS